ncbi:hypothetical protein TSH64_31975 [Azospirillum sp. TSH64]|nr:hypothetical protein TSH64_31975 [Azospirillum sp. TSH64]
MFMACQKHVPVAALDLLKEAFLVRIGIEILASAAKTTEMGYAGERHFQPMRVCPHTVIEIVIKKRGKALIKKADHIQCSSR